MLKRVQQLSRSFVRDYSCCLTRLPGQTIIRARRFESGLLPAVPFFMMSPLLSSVRGVQYEQTSETLRGINENKRALTTKWVTKSTKEYMREADAKQRGASTLIISHREERREAAALRRARYNQASKEGERAFQQELERIRDDNARRWKKGFNFFKRQGKAFTLLYITAYFGTWFLLYVGFASGLFRKEAAFDFMFLFLGTYLDRDLFYRRIEAWDTYANMGFAFVINEMLELLRFPLIMGLFFQFRPFFTGVNKRVKASIFRFGAAES